MQIAVSRRSNANTATLKAAEESESAAPITADHGEEISAVMPAEEQASADLTEMPVSKPPQAVLNECNGSDKRIFPAASGQCIERSAAAAALLTSGA